MPVSCCKLKDSAKDKNELSTSDALDYNECVQGSADYSYIDNVGLQQCLIAIHCKDFVL